MAGDEPEETENKALWRAVGLAGALAGGAAASLGTGYLREPPPAYQNGNGVEPRVRQNAENIAALAAGLEALVRHVDELSAERSRLLVRLEARVEELYDRDRALDSRMRPLEQQRR